MVESSKLNVEVKEFKPKSKSCMIDTLPKINSKTKDSITTNSHNLGVTKTDHNEKDKITCMGSKKRSNPSITKKFIIESAKNCELQNIDLKKSTEAFENPEKAVEWMIVGGKKKVIELVKPYKTNETVENDIIIKEDSSANNTNVILTETVEQNFVSTVIASKKTKKQRSKTSKSIKKGKDKNGKTEGFIIEEPNFDKETPKHKELHNIITEDQKLITIMSHGLNKEEVEPEPASENILSLNSEDKNETSPTTESTNYLSKVEALQSETNIYTLDDDVAFVEDKLIEAKACDNSINTAQKLNNKEINKSETNCLTESDESPSVVNFEDDDKTNITSAVCNWLSEFDSESLKSLFTIPLNADFVKKIKYCSEISSFFEDGKVIERSNILQQPFYQYKLVCEPNGLQVNSDEAIELTEASENIISKTKLSYVYKASKRYFGCETM